MKSIIIASTSTIHGSGYLEYLLDELKLHFKYADEILFIPYARPGGISHNDYTKNAVNNGIPYLGTSAGSNICGLTMNTTNDMPIVYPPSFKTLGLVPFCINPHYLDPITGSTHMGETRETRIKEFHAYNTQPVIGLREGSWIDVKDDTITLKGTLEARIFEHSKASYEIATNSDLGFLK